MRMANLAYAERAVNSTGGMIFFWGMTIDSLIKKAELGDAEAQYNLGCRYANDDGVHDYATAFVWWIKAANQRYAEAQYKLGYMYANGQGVKQDSPSSSMPRMLVILARIRSMSALRLALFSWYCWINSLGGRISSSSCGYPHRSRL